MAANYWRGTISNNWGTAGNWSLGVVPTSNDGNVATFDASSPNCNISADSNCNHIDLTNYSNTLSSNSIVTLWIYGNTTLGLNAIITVVWIGFSTNGTFTSNGYSNYLGYRSIVNNIIITLVGDIYMSQWYGGITTFNKTTSESIHIRSTSLYSTQLSGTATVYLEGSIGGTQISNPYINNPVIINANSGVTSSSKLSFGGSVTYQSGTFTTTGSIVYFLAGSSISGFTSATLFDTIGFKGSGTITLNCDLYARNILIGNTTDTLVVNNNTVYCQSLSSSLTSGSCSGTTTFVLNGLGYTFSTTGISNTITTNTPITNIFTGSTNSNTNAASNWSQGTVPTAIDGYLTTFDASSPNATVNAILSCNAVDFTNYTNTITMTSSIYSYGNITLGVNMGISGTGAINAYSSGKWKSNGKIWPNNWGIAISYQNCVLDGDLTVATFIPFGIYYWTLNKITNEVLTCTNGYNSGGTGYLGNLSDCQLNITGGTIVGALVNPTVFNGNITINSSIVVYNTLSYISGILTLTGSTITFVGNSNYLTIYTIPSNITYNNLTITSFAASTVILPGIINVNGILTVSNSSNTTFSGSYDVNCGTLSMNSSGGSCYLSGNINCSGVFNIPNNFSIYNNTIYCYGLSTGSSILNASSTVIEIKGGTWSGSGNNNSPIVLNGNVTISGTVSPINSLTYSAGIINTTGSTIQIGTNTYIDMKGVPINNLSFIGALSSNLYIKSNLVLNGSLTDTTSTSANRLTIKSDSTGTQRKLRLINNNQDLSFVNFTDIDASEGVPIWSYKGVISNCKNVLSLGPNSFVESKAMVA